MHRRWLAMSVILGAVFAGSGCAERARESQTGKAAAPVAAAAGVQKSSVDGAAPGSEPMSSGSSDKIVKSEEQWKKELTPEQYRVMREKGTERAFTGKYWDTKTPGVYKCAACGAVLFESATKFDAGCGWPSFYQAIDDKKIIEHVDRSMGMVRTEVTCARCGAHLGHVFDDGPNPTGLRYCINSVSIDLEPKDAGAKEPQK